MPMSRRLKICLLSADSTGIPHRVANCMAIADLPTAVGPETTIILLDIRTAKILSIRRKETAETLHATGGDRHLKDPNSPH